MFNRKTPTRSFIGRRLLTTILAITLISITAAGSNTARFSFWDSVKEFFDGAMDEHRVWNYAPTSTEIRVNAVLAIASASGRIARRGLNDGKGTAIGESTGPPASGTVVGTPIPQWQWFGGSPVINLTPLVSAGKDQTIALVTGATLAGTITDDDILNTPTATWSQVNGPGTATFANFASLTSTVTFSSAGTYALRLTASDGVNARTDEVTINVYGPAAATTLTFRDGVNAYNGTVDTFIRASQPTTAQGAGLDLQWDLDEGGGIGPQYMLIRFDNLFGAASGQIPAGAFITSATLSYTVFDIGDTGLVNEAAVEWTESSTFNNFGGEADVQPDEYGNLVGSASGSSLGVQSVDVTTSLVAWNNNPTLNLGWIVRPQGTNGTDLRSSEFGTIAQRPLLTVIYSLTPPNQAPTVQLVSPTDGQTGVSLSPDLTVDVSDLEADPLTVTYYGRPVAAVPASDFTLIALPDTQFYSSSLNGGSPAIFNAQTQWIVSQRASRNIAFVTQLGDCVQNGDNGGNPVEWNVADTAIDFLEDPLLTTLTYGIPYGIAVGNHDQSPIGNPNGTTTFYNSYFGTSRFAGRPYYGGHYGSNNDNHYELFSASGLDFIIIHLEYDPAANPAVLSWANGLLQSNPTRQGILVSHHFVNIGNPGSFGSQGQATYDALKANPNFFLMLNGHVHGEGRRQDNFNGNIVNSLLSDYQGRTNGGDGWLRIMTFSPVANQIHVQTYSPTLNQFETDADSQFDLSYNMLDGGPPYTVIGTNSNVPGLAQNSISWPGLDPNTEYQWYVTVSDGTNTVASPNRRFTTQAAAVHTISGNIQQYNFPAANTNLAGVTVDLNGDQTGSTTTDASGNYNFTGLAGGGNYLITPSLAGYNFDPISRDYSNLTANVTTADFTGYTVSSPRLISVVTQNVVPGSQAVVPVTLVSQGNENSIGFSVSYDPAVLSSPVVAIGADCGGCGPNLIVNSSIPGLLGVIVSRPAGQMFAAGTRQVVTITFNTTPTPPAFSTPLTFGNSPVLREVTNANADPLLAAYSSGAVTFATGYESDVSPRFNGSGTGIITVGDYTQTGRFAAGLDTVNPLFNELQRADSAPKLTKGNGSITAGDYTQAGRYAAGLDAVLTAGGFAGLFAPEEITKKQQAQELLLLPRIVRAVNVATSRGQQVTVSIQIDAEGDENGFGFTVSYDTTKLSNPLVTTGADLPSSVPIPNTTIAGKVGVITAWPIFGGTIPAGTREIVKIRFDVSPTAFGGPTPISFTGFPPVANEVSDGLANALPTTFTDGVVNITGPTAASVSVGGVVMSADGMAIRNARLSLTDQSGFSQSAISNAFGFYRFDDVAVGGTYVITARAKRYVFAPRLLTVADEVTNLILIAEP